MTLSPFPFLLLRAPAQPLDSAYGSETLSPLFEEGIYLASPDFWKEYRKMQAGSGRDNTKMVRALSKYRIRSCMRCTPYGTFAGTVPVAVSAEPTKLVIGPDGCHSMHVRLDMHCLVEIISAITELPHVRRQLSFYPNSSLYEISGGYRYAEYTVRDQIRHYQLVSIDDKPYIREVLAVARHGARIGELTDLLSLREGVPAPEAEAFIEDMIRSQLLVSGLEPCITGQDPLDNLIAQLGAMTGVEELLRALERVREMLRQPATNVERYQAIAAALHDIGIQLQTPQHCLQTDLKLTASHRQINRELVAAIVQQAADLFVIAAPYTNPDLDTFKQRFQARYEGAEVPLTLALDLDLGIGYPGDTIRSGDDLVDTLAVMPARKPHSAVPDYLGQFAFLKYNEYLRNGAASIVITEEELQALKQHTATFRFPGSLYLLGSLLRQEGVLDKDHFIFDLTATGGPSAANLIGRFVQGNEALDGPIRDIIQTEQAADPDVVYAELVHLPQARTGNILLRPVLRDYEIPYLGRSGAPGENQITVADLMISCRNDELYLRSKRLDKRVMPRLTTAHNFGIGSLPVYKLLCDLQLQGLALPAAWRWGALEALDYLPRVMYRNLILRRARWRLTQRDVADLPDSKAEYLPYFKTFCERLRVPARVVYAEADNQLLLDLREERGIDLFLHYLSRYKSIQVEEFLFNTGNCIVEDVAGRCHVNEMIIPVHADSSPVRRSASTMTSAGVKRKFPPGSEWLYFKLYCGSKTAEQALVSTLLPFIEHGLQAALFERFFFLRYGDELNHLRIRFYNSDCAKQAPLQASLMSRLQPLLDQGPVDKVQVDTYIRELERYGPGLIEEAEALFHNDSLAVLRFIRLLREAGEEKYRMLFALRGIDMLLGDFGLSPDQKHTLLQSLQADFFREFGAGASLRKQLNEKYRKHQAEIFSHLDPANDERNEILEAVDVFRHRSRMNQSHIHAIRNKMASLPDDGVVTGLVRGCLHMFLNRMFVVQQRKYELVVYHFLEKYYASRRAIQMKSLVKSKVEGWCID